MILTGRFTYNRAKKRNKTNENETRLKQEGKKRKKETYVLLLLEEFGYKDDKKLAEDNKKIASGWITAEDDQKEIEKHAPWMK